MTFCISGENRPPLGEGPIVFSRVEFQGPGEVLVHRIFDRKGCTLTGLGLTGNLSSMWVYDDLIGNGQS